MVSTAYAVMSSLNASAAVVVAVVLMCGCLSRCVLARTAYHPKPARVHGSGWVAVWCASLGGGGGLGGGGEGADLTLIALARGGGGDPERHADVRPRVPHLAEPRDDLNHSGVDLLRDLRHLRDGPRVLIHGPQLDGLDLPVQTGHDLFQVLAGLGVVRLAVRR